MNAYRRTTCVRIIRFSRTLLPESRSQYPNNLVKFILLMYFLKTDDVVVLQPNEVVMFPFPGRV